MAIECYLSECKFHQKDEPFCTMNECQACPVCRKTDYIPPSLIERTRVDGSGSNIFACLHCNSEVKAYLRRRVTVEVLEVSKNG